MLRRESLPDYAVTACLETVEMLREDDFAPPAPSEPRGLEAVHA